MMPELVLAAETQDAQTNSETNQNSDPSNSFMGFGKSIINKTNLTKGQSFFLILYVIYGSFCIIMASSPTILSIVVAITGRSLDDIKPPVDMNDLMTGFFIFTGLGLLYFIAYSIPELRDRWKVKQNKKDI